MDDILQGAKDTGEINAEAYDQYGVMPRYYKLKYPILKHHLKQPGLAEAILEGRSYGAPARNTPLQPIATGTDAVSPLAYPSGAGEYRSKAFQVPPEPPRDERSRSGRGGKGKDGGKRARSPEQRSFGRPASPQPMRLGGGGGGGSPRPHRDRSPHRGPSPR